MNGIYLFIYLKVYFNNKLDNAAEEEEDGYLFKLYLLYIVKLTNKNTLIKTMFVSLFVKCCHSDSFFYEYVYFERLPFVRLLKVRFSQTAPHLDFLRLAYEPVFTTATESLLSLHK